jgi:hypothetical protein
LSFFFRFEEIQLPPEDRLVCALGNAHYADAEKLPILMVSSSIN